MARADIRSRAALTGGLMEPVTIIAGTAAALGLGIGLRAGARLIPIHRAATRNLENLKQSDEAILLEEMAALEEDRRYLASPLGRKRESSIAGISDSALRHADGAYTAAYRVELAPTVFGDN